MAYRKKINDAQRIRVATSGCQAINHMSKLLQVFREIGDDENAMKIKKQCSLLALYVTEKATLPSPKSKYENYILQS